MVGVYYCSQLCSPSRHTWAPTLCAPVIALYYVLAFSFIRNGNGATKAESQVFCPSMTSPKGIYPAGASPYLSCFNRIAAVKAEVWFRFPCLFKKKNNNISLHCLHRVKCSKRIIAVDPVRRRANERLKVLPARSLSNLYQSADSILDNLFKTGGYGWRGGE